MSRAASTKSTNDNKWAAAVATGDRNPYETAKVKGEWPKEERADARVVLHALYLKSPEWDCLTWNPWDSKVDVAMWQEGWQGPD
jgi:hypothetical protein